MVDKNNPASDIEEAPSLESQSLESEAVKLLNEKDFALLKSICVAIGKDGMTVEEACILSNVQHEHLKTLAARFPIIQRIIGLKELEYKRALIKAISSKARSGDDKLATWLLEHRYPEEFGSKKKGGGGDTPDDPLGSVIAFIQEHGDSRGIVERRTAIIAPLRKSGTGAGNDAIKKLQTFLS